VGVIALASLAFSNWVMPKANLKFYTTLMDITQQKPALNIKEDIYYRDIQNYIIKVDEKSADNRGIENVYIINQESHLANDDIILAEKGEMFTTGDNRYLVLNLYNGSRYEVLPPDKEKPGTKLHVRTYFDRMEKVFDLSDFEMTRSSEDMFKDHYIMMSISQLNYYIDSMANHKKTVKKDIRELMKPHFYFMRDSTATLPQAAATDLVTYTPPAGDQDQKVFTRASAFIKNIQNNIDLPLLVQYNNTHMFQIRAQIELQRKYMLSVACMILLFIGAPFGAIVRKGGFGYPVLFALLFYIFYFILFQIGEELAKKEILATFAGIWLPTIIMLPFGVFFTYKAMNDSPLFNMESYTGIFKKLKFWGKG
jgi:lipopolysaccharide export system permease protein